MLAARVAITSCLVWWKKVKPMSLRWQHCKKSNRQGWSDEAAAHEEGPHFFWSRGYCNSPVVGEVVEEDAVDIGDDDDRGDVGDGRSHVGRVTLGGGGAEVAV